MFQVPRMRYDTICNIYSGTVRCVCACVCGGGGGGPVEKLKSLIKQFPAAP